MKVGTIDRVKICPKCLQKYTELPALSREDGSTYICPDCGTREALASIGICAEEQELIIETIHKHRRAGDSDSG